MVLEASRAVASWPIGLPIRPGDDGAHIGHASTMRLVSDEAPAEERPEAACVAGERRDGHGVTREVPVRLVRHWMKVKARVMTRMTMPMAAP